MKKKDLVKKIVCCNREYNMAVFAKNGVYFILTVPLHVVSQLVLLS